jgi:uncharacterized membrane protein YkoI
MPQRTLAALCFAAVAGRAAAAHADDEIPFDQLPPPVQRTAQAEVKDGTILEIERDQERGQTVYEIEFIQGDVKYELDIAPDGTLLRRHRD